MEGNRLSVAVLGTAGNVLYKSKVDGTWHPGQMTWDDMGGSFTQAPTMHTWGGNYLSVFAVDASGRVYGKRPPRNYRIDFSC